MDGDGASSLIVRVERDETWWQLQKALAAVRCEAINEMPPVCSANKLIKFASVNAMRISTARPDSTCS